MNMFRPVCLLALRAWNLGSTPGGVAGDAPCRLEGSTGGVRPCGRGESIVGSFAAMLLLTAFKLSTFDLITGSATVAPGARNGATCLPQLPQKIVSLSKGVLQFGHTIVRFPLGPPGRLRHFRV